MRDPKKRGRMDKCAEIVGVFHPCTWISREIVTLRESSKIHNRAGQRGQKEVLAVYDWVSPTSSGRVLQHGPQVHCGIEEARGAEGG